MNTTLLVGLALSLGAPALPPGKDQWVGQTIMSRQSGTQHGRIEPDGTFIPIGSLKHIEYKVVKDHKTYVEALEDGRSIFLLKASVVRLSEALDHFTKMMDRDPETPYWYAYRGWAYHKLEQNERAIRDYSEAIRLSEESYLFNNRGVIYRSMKKYEDSITDFTKAIVLDPDYQLGYRNRGQSYSMIKQFDKALKDYEVALKIDSNSPGNNNAVAWLLATAPDPKIRNGKRAVELAERACKLTDFKRGGLIDTLAAAYAEAGDFKKAIEYQELALKSNDFPVSDLAAARARMELFRSQKPYRSNGND